MLCQTLMKKLWNVIQKAYHLFVLLTLILFKLFIFIISLLVVVIGVVCFWGCVESFFTSNHEILNSLDISLTNINKYDALFSPAAAFFAGVASLFTAAVLFMQINMSKLQKEESIKTIFHEQLNMMINMRTDITSSVIFVRQDGHSEIGKSVFSTLIDSIYSEIIDKDKNKPSENYLKKESFLDMAFNIFFQTIEDAIKRSNFMTNITLVEINKYIEKSTKGTMSPFFHNVYTTLKMIEGNKYLTSEDRQDYFRMFRSHFSQPEFVIIYYHALLYNDYGEMKFKQLIEDTCFFHSLIQNYLPIKAKIYDDDIEKDSFGYSYRAFFHSKAEYSEYLKRQKESENS